MPIKETSNDEPEKEALVNVTISGRRDRQVQCSGADSTLTFPTKENQRR